MLFVHVIFIHIFVLNINYEDVYTCIQGVRIFGMQLYDNYMIL